MESPEAIAHMLAEAARAAGSDTHDVLVVGSTTTSIGVRGGELEDVEASGGTDVGLRVLLGRKQAVVSGSDVAPDALRVLAERAVAMARNAPDDPFAELADPARLACDVPDLELADGRDVSPDALKERALEVEAAALDVEGVTQAEGASASHTRSKFHLLTSHGFSGGWESTRHSLGVSAFAAREGHMERDYEHQGRRYEADLPSPEAIGKLAGERAVRRLGARQLASGEMPVIFERRVAYSLLGAFLSAISGTSVARGTSFLKDKMDTLVFNDRITIHDDPTVLRGLGSRPFDAEGVRCEPLRLVTDGVLEEWLLNTATARKLGVPTTGRAHRGVGSPPGVSPTNAWIAPGKRTPQDFINDLKTGLLVTEMFGPSLNANTGDYSVGVAGFAIEGGDVAYPVSEVTIAGNLLDIYRSLEVADDLEFDGAVVSPTLRVAEMTVAGA